MCLCYQNWASFFSSIVFKFEDSNIRKWQPPASKDKEMLNYFNSLSPFHSGCFGLASSELAKGAIAYRFHNEKLIRPLVN